MMQQKKFGGFTLIEILVVIAIIGILASVALVGLGPVQKKGRDARRISDLRQIQTALELYFTKCGRYPASGFSNMVASLTAPDLSGECNSGGSIGVRTIPNDPRNADQFVYNYGSNGTSYVLSARMEDEANAVLHDDIDGSLFSVACDDPIYCISI